MIKTLVVAFVVLGSACGDARDNCSVPLGTSWSQELAGLSTEGVDLRGGPGFPEQAEVGTAACLPDGGTVPGGCRKLVGRPHSGARCTEGFVGCFVWVQDDRVVGRTGLCFN